MDDIYKNIEEYNPNKKRKILVVFDMIADMLSNRNLNPVVIELFVRGRKLNISLVFITQTNFAVPKYFRLNSVLFWQYNKFIIGVENIFLGVNLEGRLNFDFHVNTLSKKASKRYHALARVCSYINKKKMTYSHKCVHNFSVLLLPSYLDVP